MVIGHAVTADERNANRSRIERGVLGWSPGIWVVWGSPAPQDHLEPTVTATVGAGLLQPLRAHIAPLLVEPGERMAAIHDSPSWWIGAAVAERVAVSSSRWRDRSDVVAMITRVCKTAPLDRPRRRISRRVERGSPGRPPCGRSPGRSSRPTVVAFTSPPLVRMHGGHHGGPRGRASNQAQQERAPVKAQVPLPADQFTQADHICSPGPIRFRVSGCRDPTVCRVGWSSPVSPCTACGRAFGSAAGRRSMAILTWFRSATVSNHTLGSCRAAGFRGWWRHRWRCRPQTVQQRSG